MSEVHNCVGSQSSTATRPSCPIPVQSGQLVACTCSLGGDVIPRRYIRGSRNVDSYYYNVPPPILAGPLGIYYSGESSEDDNESRFRMRPEEEYGWLSPPSPPPRFDSFPHVSNENNIDPYYDVPPPNDSVPLSRSSLGEWMDVEHLSRFVMRPQELDWTPPPCRPPPIVFPINSGIFVEESDEDIVLMQPSPNWVPNCHPKGEGLPYVDHYGYPVYPTILPTPHHHGPWILDDSADEEPYSTMYCCEF